MGVGAEAGAGVGAVGAEAGTVGAEMAGGGAEAGARAEARMGIEAEVRMGTEAGEEAELMSDPNRTLSWGFEGLASDC